MVLFISEKLLRSINKREFMSRINRLLPISKIILILLLQLAVDARAEFITQLYGGEGFTKHHNATVTLPEAGITGTHYALKFDSAAIAGGRVSYWFNAFEYLGVGLDASHYFGPNQRKQIALTQLCVTGFGCSVSPEAIKKFDNNVTIIGLDAMFKYPLLNSEQFSKGRLQPYVYVGPAVFITTLDDTGNFIPQGQSSRYTSVGVETGAGLMLFFTQNIGAFVEYRDMNFQVKDNFYNSAIVHGMTLGTTLGNATFNIQSIVAGGNWRF